jgi:hypothetical protein
MFLRMNLIINFSSFPPFFTQFKICYVNIILILNPRQFTYRFSQKLFPKFSPSKEKLIRKDLAVMPMLFSFVILTWCKGINIFKRELVNENESRVPKQELVNENESLVPKLLLGNTITNKILFIR